MKYPSVDEHGVSRVGRKQDVVRMRTTWAQLLSLGHPMIEMVEFDLTRLNHQERLLATIEDLAEGSIVIGIDKVARLVIGQRLKEGPAFDFQHGQYVVVVTRPAKVTA